MEEWSMLLQIALAVGGLHLTFVAWTFRRGHRGWRLALLCIPVVGELSYLLNDLTVGLKKRLPLAGETVRARLHLLYRGPRVIRAGEKLTVLEVLDGGMLAVQSSGGAQAVLSASEVVQSETSRLAS
jgi:hypothetical protein